MTLPVRTCLGCRVPGPKSELVRLIWQGPTLEIVLDFAQNSPGRGAYLHPSYKCVEKGSRRVRGALRIPGTVDWRTVSEPWADLRAFIASSVTVERDQVQTDENK